MGTYDIIVLDLDGTLTNSQKKITPKTKDALMKAQCAGKKVVLASGRPTGGVTGLADELKLDLYGSYILSFNGGHIINYADGSIIYDKTISSEWVAPVYKEALKAGLGILTYTDSEIIIGTPHILFKNTAHNILRVSHVPKDGAFWLDGYGGRLYPLLY